MTDNYDVIVVGLGAMGTATCDELAGRGLSVLGLEGFDVPHTLGSSGGQSRLIRQAYYEHPDYVPLLRRAYEKWDDLERRSGSQVLHRCGCLYSGPRAGHLVDGSLIAAEKHGVPHEVLDAQSLAERFPQFTLPDHFTTLFEPQAGFLLSELAIATFADQALRRGATLKTREAVLSWSADQDGVRVISERANYSAARLVVTVGAWAPVLLRSLGVELKVTRQVYGWVWPTRPEAFTLGTMPCWAIQHDDPEFEGIYYGFPLLPVERFGGERGLKVGHHYVGEETQPSRLDRFVDRADEADFRPALEYYLPGAQGPTLAARACMYTVTPDQHFVVDLHPGHDNVVVACGFSGHGFKFASVMGEVLADLAIDGRSDLPVGFLGIDRFAGDRFAGDRFAG